MKYTPTEIAELTNGNLISNIENTRISHVSTDSRSIQNSNSTVFFALVTKNRNGHDFIPELIKKGVTTFVVSEKIENKNISQIIVQDTLVGLQLFAQNHREKFNIPIIGITGSYGKTIVKEWLYQLLNEDYIICRSPKSYNSQIGVPLSVLGLETQHNLAIFEAGVSRKGEMKNLANIIKPTIGILTKMGEAHQYGFGSFEEKKNEKLLLFKNLDVVFEMTKNKSEFNIPFTDKVSIENCELCIQVMQYLKMEDNVIQERINKLSPIALRMEMVKGKNNSTLLNDSYNISVSSLYISLDHLSQQAKNKEKTLIISDIPETNFESKEFLNLFNNPSFSRIITVGKNRIKENLSTKIIHYNSTEELLKDIYSIDFSNQFVLIKGARKFQLEKITRALEEKKHQTILEINLEQLSENLAEYRKKLNSKTKIIAMVKAYAYGSGSGEIPKFLEEKSVDYFGIANTDEGVELRKNGIKTPIIVMNPEPSSFSELISNDLEPEIYSLKLLDKFVRELILHNKKEYPIHLKLETGMNRLGFLNSEISELISLIKSQPEVYIKSIFSHLSSADDLDEKEFTLNQISTFEKLNSIIQKEFPYKIERHILNTAGIENYPDYQFDMVRLGIGLYGINASEKNKNISPISSLKSIIIQTKTINKGESVGYGRNFITDKETKIGIIPIGYADGLRRNLGNGNYSFYINGINAPIIGNICMDICMVNISGTEIKTGDSVEIFGKNNSIEKLAKAMNTIPYEVLTSISQRVKRVFYRE